jgi:hypothetical protein
MPGTLAITIVVIVATYLVSAEIAKHAADRPGASLRPTPLIRGICSTVKYVANR